MKYFNRHLELNDVSVEETKIRTNETSRTNKWSNSILIKRKKLDKNITQIPKAKNIHKSPAQNRKKQAKGFVWLAVFVPLKSIDLFN